MFIFITMQKPDSVRRICLMEPIDIKDTITYCYFKLFKYS